MTCKHCGSSNTQSQMITKDKNSRNTLFFFVPFLIILISFAIMGAIAEVLLLSLFVGFIVALLVGGIASIISRIIPVKQVVVFVCNDCGKITKT